MRENKARPRKVSSCFDGQACAEMIQKIMGQEGIGSLCEKMMALSLKACCETKEEPREAKKKAGGAKSDQEFKPAQGKNKDQ